MKVGIFGCGFSGRTIGKRLADQNIPVWGSTRRVENFTRLESAGIHPLVFDGETVNEQLIQELGETTHLVVSIAPPREEPIHSTVAGVDPVLLVLKKFKLHELAPKLEWIGYLSTVGVYGNYDGAWIDEQATLKPTSARSRQRVRAEVEWLRMGETAHVPVCILRLSGIYGPGRNALVSADAGKSRRLVKKGQVFNRIHVGDIAQAVDLAAHLNAQGLFNITDSRPAPPQDVISFAHGLLRSEPPAELDFETAELTPMARSFYGENKRVSNAKSETGLGMKYQWPNYETALTRMFNENSWKE